MASTLVMELVETRRIWEHAPHNALPDMLWQANQMWCVLREAESRESNHGLLRVIKSADGITWESMAEFKSDVEDLRDPCLTLTPDGRLMLVATGVRLHPKTQTHQSYAWFTKDGFIWSNPIPIADSNYWLWRVTWQRNICYGIGFACGPQKNTRLYRSLNGREFHPVMEALVSGGDPSEASLIFQSDQKALCLLQRTPFTGLLGTATPPYRDWQWQDTKMCISNPRLYPLPGGKIAAAICLHTPADRVTLCLADTKTGLLEECLDLPSGGDTGYPGVVWHQGFLWVVYHSSHAEKTAVYLSKISTHDSALDPIASRRVPRPRTMN